MDDKKEKGGGGVVVGKEKTAAKKWCWLQLCVVMIQKEREREGLRSRNSQGGFCI